MGTKIQPYIPYLGNKYKIAEDIYAAMRQNFTFKNVVSLFCGGGSVEIMFARKGYNVLANDIDSGLIELHNRLIHGGGYPNDFITREMFEELKLDKNWLGAYVRQVWSFSNNQEDYLYSRERAAGDPALLVEHRRRQRHIDEYMSLNISDKIKFISNDYRDVDLSGFDPKDTILYLDPPYKGTRQYHVGEFDSEEFHKWVLELPFTAVISEYEMPEPFQCIASFDKMQESAGGTHHKSIKERLYCNKPVQIGLGL